MSLLYIFAKTIDSLIIAALKVNTFFIVKSVAPFFVLLCTLHLLYFCTNIIHSQWAHCTSIELIRLQTLEFREMPTEFMRQDETTGLEEKRYMCSI